MPLYSSSLQLAFFSNGILDTVSKPQQKPSTVKDCLQLDGNDCEMKNSYGDLEIFYSAEDKSETIWNVARSSFLDVNFLDERDYDISWKNYFAKMDRNSADYWNFGNESPAPYYKHQTSENDHDFITPNGTICEKSCSSRAVRGKATKKSSSNAMVRQNTRRNGRNHRSPVNSCDMRNIHAKQTCYNKRDNFQHEDNVNGQGKVTRIISSKRIMIMSNPVDMWNERNDLSSENGKSMCASNSEGNCSDFKETKDKIEEMGRLKAMCSPEYTEETSSSMKIPDELENSFDEKSICA
ncbi:hypothetical protein F0562_022461 [Nyssa sinensis]|uniref:Uncharacterized protein n=1 Tax=Nyssa sinensis TaxID=561372 RepID=A0A5J5BNU4_9ASTE|nr:hypothetical protein F0562_022461 [Nyssa sinensis]